MARLYVPDALQTGMQCAIYSDSAHYISVVLRLKIGDPVLLFNESGEWEATLVDISKKNVVLTVGSCVRAFEKCLETWLAFSPLKHDAMGFLIEKATELGVTDLQPLITGRTNTHRLNEQRIHKNLVEAAQQCERFCIPKLHPIQKITNFLAALPGHVHWFFALEREGAQPFVQQKGPVGFIVGPEGGWTIEEAHTLKNHPSITPVNLGQRILRAETACLALLSKQI